MGADRAHGRDRVARVEHLVRGQRVLGDLAHINGGFADVRELIHGLDQVVGRGHGAHSVEREGLGGVDRDNLGVGVRAAQDLAVEQARQAHIGSVHRGTGDLIDAVVANGAGADDFVLAVGRVVGIIFAGKSSHEALLLGN